MSGGDQELQKARARGEIICASLKAQGVKPVFCEAVDAEGQARIVVAIELIPEIPQWTKAFHYEATFATPQAFIDTINEWKTKVQKDIAIHMPSQVVAKAIAAHGIKRVQEALEVTNVQ